MMAQPAIALGLPLRLLAEADGRLGGPGDPRPRRRRLHRPGHAARGHRRLPGRHLRPRARADRPPARPRGRRHRGPARAGRPRARPGQGRDAGSARRARRPVPAQRRGHHGADVEAFGLPCVLKTTRGGYDGKGVWVVRSRRGRRRAPSTRPPRQPASRCWPRSSSTSAASCPRWWPARPAARPRPTRSSPPPSSTASATRSSPRRRTSRPPWPARRRRSRCASPVRSTSRASSPSSSSRRPTVASWSTSWRCAPTTPATGPRTAP